MRKPQVVNEKALRNLVNELLDDKVTGAIYAPEKGGVKVNPVVDPSAAETDPMNPDYKPQNAVELGVAVRQLTQTMPDEHASRVYDFIKQSVSDQLPPPESKQPTPDNHPEQEENDMEDDTIASSGTKKGTHAGTRQAENVVRDLIRKVLREEFEEYDRAVSGDDEDAPQAPPKKKVPDDTFALMAKELGMAVSGAKQFVEKALARLKLLQQELPKGHPNTPGPRMEKDATNLNDMEVLVLKAWGDYIELLQSTGELTSADVKLMHDHPEMALELDGFRDFVHHYVHNALVPTDEKGGEWSGHDPVRDRVKTFQNAPAYKGHYEWLDDDTNDSGTEYSRIVRKGKRNLANLVGHSDQIVTGKKRYHPDRSASDARDTEHYDAYLGWEGDEDMSSKAIQDRKDKLAKAHAKRDPGE